MEPLFRFVLVGSGNISRSYFQAIDNIHGAEIIGVISRNPDQAGAFGQGVEVKGDLDSITGDYDAVIIATPNGLHHEPAITAAGLGKHVLTEKPLDISLENMDGMITACSRADVRLGVSYQHRMSPDNKVVKELIARGELGRILAADFNVYCWREQAYYDSGAWRGGWEIDGGGPFIQQACHQVDLYTWFFGSPESVYSLTDNFIHDIEVEDHGAALFRHSNGMIGTFIASTIAYPGFDPVLTVISEKGTIVMENGRITRWHIKGLDNPSKVPETALHSGAASAAVTDTGLHEAIIEDFIAAVRNGRDPAVTGESARLATELILKIYKK